MTRCFRSRCEGAGPTSEPVLIGVVGGNRWWVSTDSDNEQQRRRTTATTTHLFEVIVGPVAPEYESVVLEMVRDLLERAVQDGRWRRGRAPVAVGIARPPALGYVLQIVPCAPWCLLGHELGGLTPTSLSQLCVGNFAGHDEILQGSWAREILGLRPYIRSSLYGHTQTHRTTLLKYKTGPASPGNVPRRTRVIPQAYRPAAGPARGRS